MRMCQIMNGERNILELEKDVESHDRVDGIGFTVRRTVRTHC